MSRPPTRQISSRGRGTGTRALRARTRTGCQTCRNRKVKCGEEHPICGSCSRLGHECRWNESMQVVEHRRQGLGSCSSALQKTPLSGQNFIFALPNVDSETEGYVHYYVNKCTNFLAYSNDNQGNPFKEELFPLAATSDALLHASAALSAAHQTRADKQQHQFKSAQFYARATTAFQKSLQDPATIRSDATLGACLLMCVYEISYSDNRTMWLQHLKGARALIQYRGGPDANSYLTRFFSFLDISASLMTGEGPLLPGSYWLKKPGNDARIKRQPARPSWPYYDTNGVMVDHFHQLMVFMAELARLSAKSLSILGRTHPEIIKEEARKIHTKLTVWWSAVPPALRDQSNNWRWLDRPRVLSVAETLQEDSLSSTRCCVRGCVIYAHHLQDPLQLEPLTQEVKDAVTDICGLVAELKTGEGLEMGIYFGLFMVGVTVFNDLAAEDFIRHKMTGGGMLSIYHADGALELLEVLWRKQHQLNRKHDWRQVQEEMGVKVFILA